MKFEINILPDWNMIDGSGTKFSIELFGPQGPQVMDIVGPQMQHIVPDKDHE